MSGSFFGKLGFDPGNTSRPDMGILEIPFYNGSDVILLLKCFFRPPRRGPKNVHWSNFGAKLL